MSHARVSPAEAHRLLRDAGHAYLDVRSVAEFEAGHPAGAYNVPLSLPGPDGRENPDFVVIVSASFPKELPLVVGCRSGSRSQRGAALLSAAGFVVVEQRAGMAGSRDAFGRLTEAGWEAEGLPCATCADPGHAYAELLRRLG